MSSLSAFCTKISVFQVRDENFPADVCSTLRLGSRWRNNYSSKQLLVGRDEAGSKSFSLFFHVGPSDPEYECGHQGILVSNRHVLVFSMHLKIFRVSEVFSVFGTLSACFFKHAKRCNALLNLELSSESGYGWLGINTLLIHRDEIPGFWHPHGRLPYLVIVLWMSLLILICKCM